MTGKTLIVFSTIRGLNDEVAHIIAEVLKTTNNVDVTVADLRKGTPDITPFQNIVVGGGGGGNTVYNEAVDFLGRTLKAKMLHSASFARVGKTRKRKVLKPTKKDYWPKTSLSSLSTLLALEVA